LLPAEGEPDDSQKARIRDVGGVDWDFLNEVIRLQSGAGPTTHASGKCTIFDGRHGPGAPSIANLYSARGEVIHFCRVGIALAR
jgi:hypothetical protein